MDMWSVEISVSSRIQNGGRRAFSRFVEQKAFYFTNKEDKGRLNVSAVFLNDYIFKYSEFLHLSGLYIVSKSFLLIDK